MKRWKGSWKIGANLWPTSRPCANWAAYVVIRNKKAKKATGNMYWRLSDGQFVVNLVRDRRGNHFWFVIATWNNDHRTTHWRSTFHFPTEMPMVNSRLTFFGRWFTHPKFFSIEVLLAASKLSHYCLKTLNLVVLLALSSGNNHRIMSLFLYRKIEMS